VVLFRNAKISSSQHFLSKNPNPISSQWQNMAGRVDPQKRPLALPYMPPAYPASLLFRLGKRVELYVDEYQYQ
jgi:hypothetical protein